jgi:hypothetical protein
MKSAKYIRNRLMSVAIIATFMIAIFPLQSFAAGLDEAAAIPNRVYLLSNVASENTVMVFDRAADGTLTFLQQASTGGFGSGAGQIEPPFPPFPGPVPLESQDALIKSENGRFLIAVNAGSNDVSVLEIVQTGLRLVDKVPSLGFFPVSVAEHNGLVYVANAGQTPDERPGALPSIIGFRLASNGKLKRIRGSIRRVGSANVAAADLVFSRDGRSLVMTELNGNMVDLFRIGEDSRIIDETRIPANNRTPLGAQFSSANILAIAESNDSGRRQAVAAGASVSSYRLASDGSLVPVSKAVASGEAAAGWIRFTPDGRFAFAINNGSGSISAYGVSKDGQLTLVNAKAANIGGPLSSPADAVITGDGKFLYAIVALDGLNGRPQFPLPANVAAVYAYEIASDGSLSLIGKTSGLPYTVQGIAAE